MMKLVGALSAGALAMTNTLRSRLSTNLKFRFRLRTLMVFIALSAVWITFEPKVKNRWRSLADEAETQKQLASCEILDAAYFSRSIQVVDAMVIEAEAMSPDEQKNRKITREHVEGLKTGIALWREMTRQRLTSAQKRNDLARQLRRRWW